MSALPSEQMPVGRQPTSAAAIWRDLKARFRVLATPWLARSLAATTAAEYARVSVRIQRHGWAVVLAGARSRSAHYVVRSAIGRWAAREGTEVLDAAQHLLTAAQTSVSRRTVEALLARLDDAVHALEACRPAVEGGVAWTSQPHAKPGRSKRASLGSLPPDWRGRMLARIPEDGPYGLAVACLWLLGVRPRELVHGIRIRVTPDGVVLAAVRGAKVRDVDGEPPRGQPWRKIAVQAGPGAELPLARLQRAVAHSDSGELTVAVPDARRLCDAIRAASRRALPRHSYVVTPYSFRHAWSADAKAAAGKEVSSAAASGTAAAAPMDDVSLALGHASAVSRRHYGTRRQGCEGIVLLGVLAARPLRGRQSSLQIRPPPGALQAASPGHVVP
ncbi:hypothetical protein [Roseomonas rosulenta]|uniref:hypothetical protein n=1 Tax=Roseomonas rosulenta TaxID=2748667 RepID=UPI0018E042FF|nr:hypothetical protein [Roseomonas rosulenta]